MHSRSSRMPKSRSSTTMASLQSDLFDFNLDLYCNAEEKSGPDSFTFDANLNAVGDWAETSDRTTTRPSGPSTSGQTTPAGPTATR